MKLCLIAAMGRDRSIGRGGDLAFHIGADLRHFKELTMGCPVIMGRRTFESLPKGALPGRRNIVITSQAAFAAPGTETAASLDQALALVAAAPRAFIIGGGSVYAQALPLADEMELTLIDADQPLADTFFPAFNPAEWETVHREGPADDPRTGLTYTFLSCRRK